MEDCTDRYVSNANIKQYYIDNGREFPIEDPQGLAPATATSLNDNKARIVSCGGSVIHNSGYVTLWAREAVRMDYSVDGYPKYRGFRFCVTCE